MRSGRPGVRLAFIVLILLCLTACERNDNDAKVVSKAIPPGFISLSEAMDKMEGALRYIAWESQISFLDADNITIYQTSFANEDFIVKYKDEYYINEEKYLEMVEIANATMERLNRTYQPSDTVRSAAD